MSLMGEHGPELQLKAVELLSLLKDIMSYKELSEKVGLSASTLARYVRGESLPSLNRARRIVRALSNMLNLKRLVSSRLEVDERGIVGISNVIRDMKLLRFIAYHIIERFEGRRITKVVTLADEGIPLAAHVAYLLGVEMIYASRHRVLGVRSFFEEPFVSGSIMEAIYLPRGTIRRNDSVLVLSAVVRDGRPENALLRILSRRVHAEVVGFFTIVAMGEDWISRLELPEGCEAHALVVVSKSKANFNP
ncbi:MAG: hypothetical protein DRN15_00080 [Thermoprotei archaeon]|nr:MAG: hypothetical protein DRN15_00080 [Thermoprotei archaeon]